MERIVIDATPTWSGMMPLIIQAIESGGPEAKAASIEELYRLAKHVDDQNEPKEGGDDYQKR